MTETRPELGSKAMYDQLAATLNGDPNWERRSKNLNISMIHGYLFEPPRFFRMEFQSGLMTNIEEFQDPTAAPATALVLRAPVDIWEQLLVTGELSVNTAILSRKLKVEGKIAPLMKNMQAFNYLLGKLIELDPVIPARAN